MIEQDIKLQRVKKSLKTAQIVARVLEIIFIVGFVLLLASGIIFMANSSYFNEEYANGNSYVTFYNSIIELDNGNTNFSTVIKSDVPFIQNMISENNVAGLFGMLFIAMSLGFPFLAASFHFFVRACKIMLREESPFAKKARINILVAMIILSVLGMFTAGSGLGIACGVLTWCIYTILDYGALLQLQSDETL